MDMDNMNLSSYRNSLNAVMALPLSPTTEESIGENIISPYGFTSGPYIVSKSLDDDGNVQGLLIKPIGGQVVAEVDPLDNADANARLMAAAPDMFEVLSLAREACLDGRIMDVIGILTGDVLRDIINDATGGNS